MSLIDIRKEGKVSIITITRPERRNAINGDTASALRQAFLDYDADESQRVAILTGGDSVFCAGADLKEIESLSFKLEESEHGPLGFTRLLLHKPVIAAIAGYAVAGGLEIACWADFRVADESAQFGCLERRFSVPLVDGGTVRLPQIVGSGRALDLILTGRLIDTREAYQIGLVNYLTPRGKHLEKALEIAHQLTEFPQAAMLNDRRSVYQTLGKPLEEALKIEAAIGRETWESGEGAAGAKAFSEGKGRGGKLGD
jgi:enoyl-CoA hydratase